MPNWSAWENRKAGLARSPLAMVTCYDAPFARLAAGVCDVLLVGDSVGRAVLGYDSEQQVTMDDMCHHIAAVRRGAPRAPILGDLPYQSYGSVEQAVVNAQRLVHAGADAVKLEGAALEQVRALRAAHIPVCGHLGFTPQSGGRASFVGKTTEAARALYAEAEALCRAGCGMLVLELVPLELAAWLTRGLPATTIGIGAGPHCDGQVQVLPDILGFSERQFRHTYVFGAAGPASAQALGAYAAAVHAGTFPTTAQTKPADPAVLSALGL